MDSQGGLDHANDDFQIKRELSCTSRRPVFAEVLGFC